eukprot:COSAG02_NODE_6336_length_3642_cov_3.835338_5_plen_71_part_01
MYSSTGARVSLGRGRRPPAQRTAIGGGIDRPRSARALHGPAQLERTMAERLQPLTYALATLVNVFLSACVT